MEAAGKAGRQAPRQGGLEFVGPWRAAGLGAPELAAPGRRSCTGRRTDSRETEKIRVSK